MTPRTPIVYHDDAEVEESEVEESEVEKRSEPVIVQGNTRMFRPMTCNCKCDMM